METPPEVMEIEALAKAADVPMPAVLKRAGVAASTYWRWRNKGLAPHTRTLRKLKTAIEEARAA